MVKLLRKYTNAEKENAMTCNAAIWYLLEYCPSENGESIPWPAAISGIIADSM